MDKKDLDKSRERSREREKKDEKDRKERKRVCNVLKLVWKPHYYIIAFIAFKTYIAICCFEF